MFCLFVEITNIFTFATKQIEILHKYQNNELS